MAESFAPVLLIACVSSALLSCAARTSAPRSETNVPAALSAGEVHALAERHCASCHQGSVSREKPKALAVFDLDQPDWIAGLAAEQFSVLYQRMAGELDAATRARLYAYTERERASAALRPGSSAATPAP